MIIKKTKKDAAASKEKITKEDQEKINSLKNVIEEAEKNLFSARAMLARLEKQNKPSVQKKTYGASPDGKIIEGVFDGQIMIGNDGKQYPVPANYASKSKLVEGDMLKLTITDDGNFIYKQIGPVDRKRLIGIVREDESGNFIIEAEGKNYKILLASVTYYRAQVGDEVTIVVPKEGEAIWCSIENITKKASELKGFDKSQPDNEKEDPFINKSPAPKTSLEKPASPEKLPSKTEKSPSKKDMKQVIDEWTPKLSQLEKEAAQIEAHTQKSKGEKDVTIKSPSAPKPSQNQPSSGEKVAIKVSEAEPDPDKKKIVAKDFPDTPEEFFSR